MVRGESFQETVVSAVRGGKVSTTKEKERNVIRRVYGPDNANVRNQVDLLEQQMPYRQSGFRGDVDHVLPYKNHPYDPQTKARRLQDTNAEEEVSAFKPMRIYFETQALDGIRSAENGAKVDFIKSKILPRTGQFWSDALSVVRVDGNLRISAAELANRQFCGDSEFTKVPAAHISTGVANVDLILYVSGTNSVRFCGSSTLAVAVACNFDQFDRPTAGAINFCLNQIELDEDGTASETVVQDNVDVAIHEAAHVLGMSSNSYRFFWDPETGSPRTPRPFTSSSIICVDGVSRTLILPGEETMKFFTAVNGQRYASIVTPKVRTIARNQFDCQSLAGAQLENQPTGSQSCTGDHWDERLFYPEALSGVISPTTNILSHLTLALMEDSGWYQANYSISASSPWGLNAGCEFITDPCLVSANGGDPTVPEYGRGYFCNKASRRGCSPALSHKMACTVIDYSLISPPRNPDPQFQYFPDNPAKGGPRQADYCPLYGSTYYGRDAEALSCQTGSVLDLVNLYNEDYGDNSMCFETSSGEGRCYVSQCVLGEFNLRVRIRGEWLTCTEDFQEIEISLSSGALTTTLVCPRLSTACPDMFCPANCAGRGVCNFENVVNGTIRPKCDCFDPKDTSPGCSDSLVLDGKYLEDSSGLISTIEEGFFEPLVAVFVDDPETWTTESWGWAAGIFVVFLLMILCICSSCWPSRKPRKRAPRRF